MKLHEILNEDEPKRLPGQPFPPDPTGKTITSDFYTLHNVHKKRNAFDGIVTVSDYIRSHILGLMLIKDLERVVITRTQGVWPSFDKLVKAVEIINKHLPGGNIHEVQEELIEAGLKEFARL